MNKVHSLEEYIKVLKSKLGEAKGSYKKALGLRGCGVRANYFKAKIETFEAVINSLEKLQSNEIGE